MKTIGKSLPERVTRPAHCWILLLLACLACPLAFGAPAAVDDETRLATFTLVAGVPATQCVVATTLCHGDFDRDGRMEVAYAPVFDPDATPTSAAVYEYDKTIGYMEVEDNSFGFGYWNHAMVAGHLNGDDNLDIAMVIYDQVVALFGQGDNTFALATGAVSFPGGRPLDAHLFNYNNDQYLDYVYAVFDDVMIFTGSASGFSQLVPFAPPPPPGVTSVDTRSIAAADFNEDGWDDLALSTHDGMFIYLNDQQGSFAFAHWYDEAEGTGNNLLSGDDADVNNDGHYDIVIPSPLWVGATPWTSIVVYLGGGDGSFTRAGATQISNSVALKTGDIDADGFVDVIYTDNDGGFVGLLLGDGSGLFSNEFRYYLPQGKPLALDLLDIEGDGDLDIALSAEPGTGGSLYGWYYLLVNDLNPNGLEQVAFTLESENSIDVVLTAPNGAALTVASNTLPSGEMYRRDLDGNSQLDLTGHATSLRSGKHEIRVNQTVGTTGSAFSLSYTIDGVPYVIADNQPMSAFGYVFPVYPDGESAVTPEQGATVGTGAPFFIWNSEAIVCATCQSSLPMSDEVFEVATDLDFGQVVERAVVHAHSYQMRKNLNPSVPTTYYWRVREVEKTASRIALHDIGGDRGAGEETEPVAYPNVPIHVFTVVPASSSQPLVLTDDSRELTKDAQGLPTSFALSQNYPNPFNPTTSVDYALPEAAHVLLQVVNVLGQTVETLIDASQPAGYHSATWDASRHASGLYFYRLEAGSFQETRKMVLLK